MIAYSTMSQIGYMFVGVGIGAYSNGMFHLMTHAFFKALLFLGAGMVIHALARRAGHAQDGRPAAASCRARLALLVGALALVGIPPFSGFFSKDLILAAALATAAGAATRSSSSAILGAFLTGLYTFRLIFLVFSGEPSRVRARALPPPTTARGRAR